MLETDDMRFRLSGSDGNLVCGCVAVVALLVIGMSPHARAADWPMYRMDAGRTASTPESLPAQLSMRWVHRASLAPVPAWPRSRRMNFDRVLQMIVTDGRVVFVGRRTTAEQYIGAATQTVDLAGGTMVPGFVAQRLVGQADRVVLQGLEQLRIGVFQVGGGE
jgi:hypothetical protein